MQKNASRTDVLIFVEDPGAANCIIGLPQALARKGRSATVYCSGTAVEYLRARRVSFLPLTAHCSPEELLERVNPSLVMTGTSANPHTFGLRLVEAAQAAGVLSGAILDSALNAGLRFRGTTKNPMRFAPRFLLCPDEATKGEFLKLGFPAKNIFQTGHPQLDACVARSKDLREIDRTRLREQLFPGAKPGTMIATFVGESSNQPSVNYRKTDAYTLHGRGRSVGRTEIVIEEFLDAIREHRSNLYLVLRVHPRQDALELKEYMPEFDQISKSEPPLDIIWASDFAVGMTSMLLYEAAAIGVPTLCVVPRHEEQQWLPSVTKGWTKAASEREALRIAVEEILANARVGSKRKPRAESSGALLEMAEILDEILERRQFAR